MVLKAEEMMRQHSPGEGSAPRSDDQLEELSQTTAFV
jgi:hypothetical protein